MGQNDSSSPGDRQVTVPGQRGPEPGSATANELMLEATNRSLQAVRGVVPALPGRMTSDFDDQIEDAMEEEAQRIVGEMSARLRR